MKRGRVFGLAVAGLVIVVGAVAVFLLPYLHHRAYPDTLVPRNRTETRGYASLEDARIDDLGSADRIRSEADALAYIQALRPQMLTPLSNFDEDRLARAEYAAIRDPQKRIPESLVVNRFNALVDELSAPASSHVTVEELHVFRAVFFCLRYPRAAAPLPDGSLPRDFRPAEAFYLLDQLTLNGGVPRSFRVQVSTVAWLRSLLPIFRASDRTQMDQFILAGRRYSRRHPGLTPRQLCDDLFGQLGIN